MAELRRMAPAMPRPESDAGADLPVTRKGQGLWGHYEAMIGDTPYPLPPA